MNQKRIGILITYINLAFGMIVNIFLTPMLISSLGDVDYSIYKVIQAFAGPLSLFHLGISTIVTRSIIKCDSHPEYTEKQKQNTLALSMISSGVLSAIVVAAGVIMYYLIPGLYGETFDTDSVSLGQKIFLMYVLATVFHVMTDAFSGCIIGHEKYVISAAIPLSKSILKITLIVILLKLGFGVFAVAAVDLFLAVAPFAFAMVYSVLTLRERPHLYQFDRKQVSEILLFGSAIFLQAIVNQVNNNVDIIILGAFADEKQIITMYSSALAIYAVYNSLVSQVTNFFLPKATRLISNNASGKELTDFVIVPGRFQAIVASGCVLGFAVFGKHFISIWIGARYIDAYYVTLLLMIPVTIPLVENAAISILDAALKRMFRSVVLVVMALLNVAVSVILVRRIGYYGAAIGTVLSLLLGHGLLMNVYYKKTFALQIGRMFYSIFKGILPAGFAAAVFCIPLNLICGKTVAWFVAKCLIFCVIYGIFLWIFGLNSFEKQVFIGGFRKLKKKLLKINAAK